MEIGEGFYPPSCIVKLWELIGNDYGVKWRIFLELWCMEMSYVNYDNRFTWMTNFLCWLTLYIISWLFVLLVVVWVVIICHRAVWFICAIFVLCYYVIVPCENYWEMTVRTHASWKILYSGVGPHAPRRVGSTWGIGPHIMWQIYGLISPRGLKTERQHVCIIRIDMQHSWWHSVALHLNLIDYDCWSIIGIWNREIHECLAICLELQVLMFFSCSIIFEWELLGWVDNFLIVVVMGVQLKELKYLCSILLFLEFNGFLVEYGVVYYLPFSSTHW